MIICDAPQGSDEWLRDRAGVPSASMFKAVKAKGTGKTRESYMIRLAAEIMTDAPVETYQNGAMQHGTETEPAARSTYEFITGNTVDQVGFIKLDSGLAGCSPDGLIGEDGGLEIKCPNTETHIRTFLSGKMPPEHKPQVQGSLWICERDWWDFVSFDDRMNDNQNVIYRQHRDEAYIKTLSEEVEKFAEELEKMIQKLRA